MTYPQRKSITIDDRLTWQQREDISTNHQFKRRRRGRKAPKSVSLDPKAIIAQPKATAIVSTPLALQPQTQGHKTRTRRRNKAQIQVSVDPNKDSAPSHGRVLLLGQIGGPQKSGTHHKKRKPGRKSNQEDMIARPLGASVPPHLRKHATTPLVVKADVGLGDSIDIGSPPASTKSHVEEPCQSRSALGKPESVVVQPLSPPTTIEKPPKQAERWDYWDLPVLEQSPAPPKPNKNLRWPRIPKVLKEKHAWISRKEIPKELSSGDQSNGGVTFNSDSGEDPAYDVKKLIGWNGDWLPPPEEWAARKGFTNHHFSQVIEKWANEHSRSCTKLMDIKSPSFLGIETKCGEWLNEDLVPRYWLHEKIDGTSPREFWQELLQRAPAPLTDTGFMDDPPYWERWNDNQPENCFMTAVRVPEAKINPNDPENELESAFAMLCTTERLARIREIKDSRKRRAQAKRNRPMLTPAREAPPLTDRRINAKANIYLRPVQPADIPGIMAIYNHYVQNTVHAVELEEQSESQIRCWIDTIVQGGLPCLVAVAKRNQRKGPQGYVTETIAGFVHLADDISQYSMYRFTFELELYVHPGYIRQGVGRCLLDQIMYIANTGYNKKGGFEWVNDFEYLKNGKNRTIKTILVSLHYERGEDIDWATNYLGDFGFKKAGHFAQVGHKIGKVVDKVMFQVQTTESIDPNSIPTMRT